MFVSFAMQPEFSRAKRTRVLTPNDIREIVMDSDSEEETHYACGETNEQQAGPSSRRFSSTPHASPDFSASSSEDEEAVGNVTGQQLQPCVWALPPKPQKRVVHTFTGASNGKSSEAVHITKESTPLSVRMLFFAEIITLLVVETNRYYLDNSDDRQTRQREVTEAEMFAFLALTLQMGHTIQGRLRDYLTKMEELCTPFYGQTMARARYFHILRFLHFTDNRKGVDRKDDRLEITRLI